MSGCYSGSWIAPLASDDRIVITSTVSEQENFGCPRDRPLEIFGDAFLSTPFSENQPLSLAFEKASEAIAARETTLELCHSNPRVSIGRNMKEEWDGKRWVKNAALIGCSKQVRG